MNTVIEIGTKFIRKGYKHPKEEEVIDIHTTYDNDGNVVKVRYVCAHELMGQQVVDYDVPKTTILRAINPDYSQG
jgi:hypothetical protein